MWSAADNTEGAGGFLDSTYNGETTQSGKSDTIRGNAIVPLMIGHLIDEPLDTLKLWGTEIKLIQLVAYVRDVQRVTTKISYELVDETGSVMAIQWIEDGNSKGPATVPVGSYARVIGSHRETAGKPHVFVLKIVPVTKMVEVFEHLLEVTYLCLKGKEIFAAGEVAPAVTDDADNDGCQGMNKDQALVFKIIKSENDSESGIEKSSLRMKLPNNVRDKLDEILEFLVCEGHIYTTCTDDHFKTT